MAVVNRFSPSDFAVVLGTLLTSVLDAQAKSARATVDFINDVGFISDEKNPGAMGKLRTVSFRYRKLDENQLENDFELEIPLLGMVDIPLIVVKSAKFDFEYEVNYTETNSGTQSGPRVAPTTVSLMGRIARAPLTKGESATKQSSNLKVSIELEKAELPIGLSRVLDVVENATADRKTAQ